MFNSKGLLTKLGNFTRSIKVSKIDTEKNTRRSRCANHTEYEILIQRSRGWDWQFWISETFQIILWNTISADLTKKNPVYPTRERNNTNNCAESPRFELNSNQLSRKQHFLHDRKPNKVPKETLSIPNDTLKSPRGIFQVGYLHASERNAQTSGVCNLQQ